MFIVAFVITSSSSGSSVLVSHDIVVLVCVSAQVTILIMIVYN